MADKTAPQWVTPDDIVDVSFGLHIQDDEKPALNGLIVQAEQKIKNKKSLRVQERIANGTLDPEAVRSVVIDMVLRVVKNPMGYQSDGVGTSTTAYFRGAASGAIELLKEDVAALEPHNPAFRSVRVSVPRWRIP